MKFTLLACVQRVNEQTGLGQLLQLCLDLRGAVGHRHEEGEAQPQSLQQDDNQPLGPVQDQILDGVPPVKLHHKQVLLKVTKDITVHLLTC